MWSLRSGSFTVINLSEPQIQASTMIILTNKSGTSTICTPSVAAIELEPTNDSVFVLSDLENDICAIVYLLDTSSSPFKNENSIIS